MSKQNTDKTQRDSHLLSTPIHAAQDKAHSYDANGNVIKRAQVDDESWDRTVMQLMEEYDEAWTRLADL